MELKSMNTKTKNATLESYNRAAGPLVFCSGTSSTLHGVHQPSITNGDSQGPLWVQVEHHMVFRMNTYLSSDTTGFL